MNWAADTILVLHFAFVSFVVGGLILTWLGAVVRWAWVRNFWFRAAHLAAICFVVAEAMLGIVCPLTFWEDALRGQETHASFIARWVHQIMFYELPESVFTATYAIFALAVAITYWLVPPREQK